MRWSIAGRWRVHCAADRFRLMLSVDSNRLYAGGGQLERIRLFGLGVATPNGRAGLRFDFLGQTCGEKFRRDLLRRRGHCHTNRFYWSLLTPPPVPDLTIPIP